MPNLPAPEKLTKDKVALFADCPLCGFHFPKPQDKCRSAKACEARSARGKNGSAPAAPAADPQPETVTDVKERIEQRAALRRAASAKGEAIATGDPERVAALRVELNGDVTEVEVVKVKLDTPPKRAAVASINVPGVMLDGTALIFPPQLAPQLASWLADQAAAEKAHRNHGRAKTLDAIASAVAKVVG